MTPVKVNVQSEIGRLKGVILHTPGAEVENMTPRTAQRALYSDILNLSIAQKEYAQLNGVLKKYTKTYQVNDLLKTVLDDRMQRDTLVRKICSVENALDYFDALMDLNSKELTTLLIEGLPAKIDTLTAYIKDEYYALSPLYNFYFTRDASASVGKDVLVCKMANQVRVRESMIMQAIFECPQLFDCEMINANDYSHEKVGEGGIAGSQVNAGLTIEGGDVEVVNDHILLIGNGLRTSTQGIDMMISRFCKDKTEGEKYILVQELPGNVESFIHLDMVFTMLDRDSCLIYEPLILGDNEYRTVLITIDNGKVKSIKTVANIISALRRLGVDLKPVICGGDDEWNEEREQWHSGANSFALAPGKVFAYARNIHTIEAMNDSGYEVLAAKDVIAGKKDLDSYKRCVVTIEGSELPRGGGGARCMTMPVVREKI
jgi:arginine deiminase